MNRRKILSLFGTLVLLFALLPLGALAAQPAEQDILAKIEPLVLQELASADRTDFFIWMKEKADLSPAYQLKTKLEKGRFVYETLVATAERTQGPLRRYLDGRGANYEAFYIANKIWVRSGDYDLLLAVAARPDVAQITANHKFQLQEPMYSRDNVPGTDAVEPNITFVNADDVWAMGITGQGVVLADDDTGMDETHPALARHYRGCLNPPTCSSWDHNYNWWDATGTYPTDPYDGHSHGTHTSGTIVGDDGGTNQIGMAPGAQIIHCKNMTDGGSGNDGTFTTCFQWNLAPWDLNHNNPRPDLAPAAINNSWGYWGGNAPQFKDEIQALQAAGIAVEVSAGNEGPSCATLRSPGDYWEVITTGSVNHASPFPGTITGFSSRGPSDLDPTPPHYFPDVMAPGENVRSSIPGGSYGLKSGTSMAGPHVVGLIGLMWSACPSLAGMVDQTYQIIKDTAVPLNYVGSCGGDYTTGPNNDWGYGTIDALAAVQAAIAQCAGIGYLDGHVTDAQSGNPVVGATITALRAEGGQWSKTTDASGYYTATVPAGHFTVSAAHPLYTGASQSGVVVVTDTVTTVDFQLVPRGHLVGYITDADNGFPLEGATVTADDGTTDDTDASGYYEMYLDAGTHVITASAANYAPAVATVSMLAGQPTRQDFALLAQVSFIPKPVHVTLLLNTTDSAAAQVLNRRAGPYPFTTYEIAGGFRPGPEATWPGPDGFGYTGETVDFDWIEIRDSGTPITGLSDDSYAGPFNIGFTFPFYGASQTQFYVSSNGFLSFGSGSTDYSNDCPLPNSATPNNIIAPMWDDLYPNYTIGGVYYQTFNSCPIGSGKCTVVEYRNWAHCCNPNNIAGTFEAVLFENGSVLMQVQDGGSEEGLESTTAIEGNNAPANYGLTYACNAPNSLPDGLSICYLYPGSSGCIASDVPWLGEAPTAGTVPAGGSLNMTLFFTATAAAGVTQTGDYYATLVVNGSPRIRVPVTMTVVANYIAPEASFTSNTPACLGEEAVFTNTSNLGLPPAADFLWDFGDGITSTLRNPTHLYAQPGTYSVTLQVCNVAGCDTAEGVFVVEAAPQAGFTYAVDELTVAFTDTSQYATAYLWDFGDGITDTVENPVHTYAAEGTYTVTQWAFNGCGADIEQQQVTVGVAPAASFLATSPVCLGEPTVFTNTTTGTPPIAYLWDFGDGITDTVENPVHTYAAPGPYTVTLAAQNDFGADQVTGTVEVLPLPTAGFTYTLVGGVATFTNLSQNTTSYLWDFGDGITSTLENPVHTYTAEGTYTVTLWAGGPCGTAEASAVLEVSLCDAAEILTVTTQVEGCVVTFGAEVVGDEPFSYLWDFGPFGTSTEPSPVVDFRATGTYTGTLAVSNCAPEPAVATFSVAVECALPRYSIYVPLVLRGYTAP